MSRIGPAGDLNHPFLLSNTVELSPAAKCTIMACRNGFLERISTGKPGPTPKVTVPLSTRLDIFWIAAAPPTACMYFSITSYADGRSVRLSAAGCAANRASETYGAVLSAIGILTGLVEPRWHV